MSNLPWQKQIGGSGIGAGVFLSDSKGNKKHVSLAIWIVTAVPSELNDKSVNQLVKFLYFSTFFSCFCRST